MIYFKGPKAPDFHFEKSRPSLKRIASQAYRRKKRHARLCILSVPNPPDSLPGTPPPAARFPQAAASSFFPSLFLSKTLPPRHTPTGRAAAGFYRITSPAALSTRRHPVRRIFFSFFFRRLRPARPPGPFSAPGYGASVSAFIPHIPSPCQHFFPFSRFFFHPPPSRRRFHRPGPGEGFSGGTLPRRGAFVL